MPRRPIQVVDLFETGDDVLNVGGGPLGFDEMEPSFAVAESSSSYADTTVPELAPGIKPVSPRNVEQPQSTDEPILSPDETRNLVSAVADDSVGLNEIKLSDGTVIKGVAGGQMPGMSGEARAPEGPQLKTDTFLPGPMQEPQLAKNTLWDQLGGLVESPRFRQILARTGMAIAPNTPVVQAMGQIGSQLATTDAYSQYLTDIKAGRTPEPGVAGALSPELKMQAQNEVLSERRAAVSEEYMGALGEQARATTAGMFTADEKKRMWEKEMSQNLNLGEMRSRYMGLGQGYYLDAKTGTVKKGYDWQTGQGGSLGNLNTADYRLFMQMVVPDFVNAAKQNKYNELVQSHGEDTAKVADLMEAFRDPVTGGINFEAVMSYLTPEQRAQFAGKLHQYTVNYVGGVPPTGTFLQQQAAPREVTQSDGTVWRIDPVSGKATRIK